jgi:drug/metabolite transporter (DMT)-like permease
VTWVLLAGGAAVAYAFHGAWSKRVAGEVGPLVGSWALFAFALPLLAVYLALQGIPDIGPSFWPVLGVNCVLNLGASYLFLSALRAGDLGVTYPLLALTPVFVIPVEFVLLGELPGRWGAVGILMVVAGVYLLNFSHRRAGLLAPILALTRSPGARRTLGVVVLWSMSGTLDRVAVLDSSPAFYGVALAGGLSLLFLPLIGRARHRQRRSDRIAAIALQAEGTAAGSGLPAGRLPEDAPDGRLRFLPSGSWMLVVHGALFATMFIMQMEALDLALASYVLSIKRTGAILAVLLGWLVFREGALRHRFVGTIVTVAGVAVLVVWG